MERSHGITHVGSYSNAAHQWGVAMLMHALWPEDFPRLAIYCLSHDVPEAWVGDIPAPTKRNVPGLKETLDVYESRINRDLGLPAESELEGEDMEKLKACDRLELYLWAKEQVMLGNRFVEGVVRELDHVFEIAPLLPRAASFYAVAREFYTNPPAQDGVMRRIVGV